TALVWPSRDLTTLPSAASRSTTRPSPPAVSTRRPSGRNAAANAPIPSWARGTSHSAPPVRTSYRVRPPSFSAAKSRRPAGEDAARPDLQARGPVAPGRGGFVEAPEADELFGPRPDVAAADGGQPAAGRRRHAPRDAGPVPQHLRLLRAGGVPDGEGAVVAR